MAVIISALAIWFGIFILILILLSPWFPSLLKRRRVRLRINELKRRRTVLLEDIGKMQHYPEPVLSRLHEQLDQIDRQIELWSK